ncbi:MAG: thioredoxin [Ectothiorhodospiraceae bacterium]|nr:thioredoxin [Ectothiorhodospiraceae bacterium]MCH8503142.1 thioredoxin [Ectothiorhodospiraceae bacterium]
MSQSPHIKHVTTETFQQDVVDASRQQPVLVDFWADWCGPCKQLMPVLEKLATEYRGSFLLAKVNCDQEQQLAAQIGVRSLPTVILVKDGQLADQFTGALPEGEIRKLLEQHVPKPEDSPEEQARELMAQGDFEAALPLLKQAYQARPEDTDLVIDLARALFNTGALEDADALLAALPDAVRHDDRVKAMNAQRGFAERLQELPPEEELRGRAAGGDDPAAIYGVAMYQAARGDYPEAMEMLLVIVRRHRAWEDGKGRTALLEMFDLLGPEHPLTRSYRQKLFQLLY